MASIQEQVKEKYGSAARAVAGVGQRAGVSCDPGLRCCDPITSNLYSADEKGMFPKKRSSRHSAAAIRPRS